MSAPTPTIKVAYDDDVRGAADALLAVLRRPTPRPTPPPSTSTSDAA